MSALFLMVQTYRQTNKHAFAHTHKPIRIGNVQRGWTCLAVLRDRRLSTSGVDCRKISGARARASQVKPSNCFRFPNSQQSGFLTACFTFLPLLDTSLSSLTMRNLQSYPTTVLNERMQHSRGSKHTLTPLTYFRGSRPSKSGSTPPAFIVVRSVVTKSLGALTRKVGLSWCATVLLAWRTPSLQQLLGQAGRGPPIYCSCGLQMCQANHICALFSI